MKTMLLAAFGAAALTMASLPAHAQFPGYVAPSPNPAEVQAGTYVAAAGHARVLWSISHMGLSTYVGVFEKLTSTLKIDPKAPASAQVEATVDINSVATGNPAMDKHMVAPDILNAAKFPTATFKSTSVKVTGDGAADVSGDLTLLGVTRPVVMKATFVAAGINPITKKYTVGFQGKTQIKRSEFGSKFLIPMIGDEMTLQMDIEFAKAD